MSDQSQGQPSPQDGQGTPPPEGEQQKTAGMTADEFNRAWSARERVASEKAARAQAERDAAFETRLASMLEERLSAALKATATPPTATGKGDPPPPPKLEDMPEWATHRKEVEGLKRQAAEAAAREQAATQRTRATTLQSTLRDALTRAGVPADRLAIATGHLISATNTVGYSDGGAGDDIVFRSDAGDEQSLSAAIKPWLKANPVFLPPQLTGGSGGGPGRGGPAPVAPNDPRGPLRLAVRALLDSNGSE